MLMNKTSFTSGPLLIAVALMALIPALVSAQGRDRSLLSGTVVDESGAVVTDTAIVVESTETSVTRELTTDRQGYFAALSLPPGVYRVTARKPGFSSAEVVGISLQPSTPANLRITLKVGVQSDSITISASDASTVNVNDATRGNAIQEKEVKTLPFLARNPIGLLTLQPGVVFTGQSNTESLFQGSTRGLDQREGAVNGIRGNQSNIQVDGVDSNDFETQAAFTSVLPVTLDSIREFRVTTANANVTDGVASGAQVQLITKSGSNEFHGNLREYNRNTALAANSFFSNRSGLAKPELKRNLFGGSLGGPVIRDRVFFFFDYEGRREQTESPQVRTGPSETLKQGIITYRTTNGTLARLTPADVKRLDPLGIGLNSNATQYLSLYPQGNDPAAGPDGGLNFTAFRFNAPLSTDNNIYTSRVDFNLSRDGRHTLSWRGTLGDLRSNIMAAQFPDMPAASTLLNNSKGFAATYTAQIRPTLINTVRYGLTRQGLESSGAQGDFWANTTIGSYFIGGDFYTGTARANGRRVPVNEIVDDLTYTRGKHTIQAGGSFRFIRDHSVNAINAYPTFYSFPSSLRASAGDPYTQLAATGDASVIPADSYGFTQAFMALTGTISLAQATFLTDPKTKSFLPAGTPQQRNFAQNGLEFYIQDSWRVHPHLAITAGVRYTYYTPVWETNGAMVRPTVDVRDWWNGRQANMYAGIPSDVSPLVAFDLAGKANNQAPWYNPDRNNWAPRLALAYSPHFESGVGRWLAGAPGRSSFRAGFGIYYDRVGGALAAATDKFGSAGMSTSAFSSYTLYDFATAPRVSGQSTATGTAGLPPLSAFLATPTSTQLPYSFAPGSGAAGFMVDNRLSTPYSMQASFSFQRELPHQVVLDVGYVGTFGRQQLSYVNLAQYYGYFQDPKSGQNLWGAYNQIVDQIGRDPMRPAINPNDPAALQRIAPIAFFENLLPNLPAFSKNPTLTPTQAFYKLAAQAGGNWTQPLRNIDTGASGGNSAWSRTVDPGQDGYVLFQPQFNSLSTWMNYGSSSYHSMQLTARRNVGKAMFAANYVLSKSRDNGSAPENNDTIFGAAGADQIQNAFRPKAGYAFSNFDLRHNFSAHGVVDLPFGKNERFGSNAGRTLNALIGGWTTSTVWRWRSGFPLSIGNGNAYPTDTLNQGPATLTGPISTDLVRNGAYGLPNLFRDPSAALSLVSYTRPGEVGSRNAIRGPGAFTLDLAVHKRFKLPWGDSHRLEFRGAAFNAFNNVNFATQFFNSNLRIDRPANFGNLTGTSGPRGGSREIELAVRYDF